MIPNYLMAQVPTYPTMLLFPPPDVPGDFVDEDETKQRDRSDLLTDAILFDRLNEDRSKKPSGQASGGQPSLMSDDMSGFVSPYANPYYAQQQQDRQQQNTLKQAKDAWDWYRRYQNWFGGSAGAGAGMAPAIGDMGGYMGMGGLYSGPGAAPPAMNIGVAGSPSAGSGVAIGDLGGLGLGAGAAGGATGLGSGATLTSMYGLPAAGSTSLAGTTGGMGAAAGGAGGLMGILGPLGVLGAFALLAYDHAEKTSDKDRAEREAGLPAWEAGDGRHITRLKTDDERLDWYHQMYG